MVGSTKPDVVWPVDSLYAKHKFWFSLILSRIVGSLSHFKGMPSKLKSPTLDLWDLEEEGELARLPLDFTTGSAMAPNPFNWYHSQNPCAGVALTERLGQARTEIYNIATIDL